MQVQKLAGGVDTRARGKFYPAGLRGRRSGEGARRGGGEGWSARTPAV